MLFKEVLGQHTVKKRLIEATGQQKISHAQLFFGKPGSGTIPMALAYAQYILCQNKQADDACGLCPDCLKISKLVHPDLHFIFPVNTNDDVKKDPTSDKFLPIWRKSLLQNPYLEYNDWVRILEIENKQAIINTEDCSNILDKLSLKSYASGYKIMILWMAEKIHHAAAPKLLKILEEPPEKTLFIVISENLENILNTILSRLQMVKLEPLSAAVIQKALEDRFTGSENNANVETFAKRSEGNFNKALQLMQSEGHDFEGAFLQWMRWCFVIHKDNTIVQIQDWIESFAKASKEQQKAFFEYGLFILSQCIKINQNLPEFIFLSATFKASLEKFAPFIHTQNIAGIEREFEKAIFHIERNVNVKMIVLDVSLKLSKLLREKE